ncbi:MAG: chromosome segregation protein SMC [Clostridiales bacterium]|nr:chromosome segregation protein SMC [Clostridiales bacterium]
MNFKKLEIRGFKSFADKVTIEFKDGVTAIIGPNGCGKSNIADAIRWTLGEQSAKTLRGKSMQDVIFNGTENRRSLSYCEVSLYFDNEGGKVFPGLNFDEVVITRRLDRSGNSEYYINRSRCRMKDIINLTHDTGIGKEGYSIIGQGRIDEILSVKPDDRRHIFEEAAGISKFRYQRNEAERKLEKVSQNLSIANERIAELERQLNPLRKQAEATKKYFELKEALRKQEVNLFIYQYENNEKVKSKIYERLRKTNLELEENEHELQEAIREFDKLMEELAAIDDLSKALNAELLTLKVDAERIAGESKVFQLQLTNLTEDETRLKAERTSLETRLSTISERIENLKAQKEEKLKYFVSLDAEYKKCESEYNNLSEILAKEESELERKNLEYVRSVEELSALKGNLTGLTTEKGINIERQKNLSEALNLKRAQLDEQITAISIAQGTLDSIKEEIAELTQKNNEILSERMELKQAVEQYNIDIMRLNSKIGELDGNIKALISVKENYRGYQEAVKNLMNDAKSNPQLSEKIMGVVAEVINVPEEYITAIDCALGSTLQNVIVKTEDDAKHLINYLKMKRYGRATFRPLSACRDRAITDDIRAALNEKGCLGLASQLIKYNPIYNKLMAGLLGDTVVVDNIDTGVRLFRNYRQAFKIVTLDGDIFAKNGSITGGSVKSEKTGLLEQEKNIALAKEALDRQKASLDALTLRKLESEKEIETLTQEHNNIDGKLKELSLKRGLYEERVKLSSSQAEHIKAEIQKHTDELEHVNRLIEEIERQISSIDRLEMSVQEKKEKYGALNEQSKTISQEKKSEKERLYKRIMELRIEIATVKSAIDSLDTDIYNAQRDEASLKESLLDVNARLMTVTSRLDSLRNAPVKEQLSEKDLKRIEELEKEVENFSEKKKAMNARLSELDGIKSRAQEEKALLTEKKIRDEGLLERADIEINNMADYILNEYNLTYGNALEIKDENFKYYGAQSEIASIKREIARLGDVNLRALQDLQELEERYQMLTAERDDVQAAYDDLKKIITDLTAEMVVKFNDAFEKINANFQTIFKKLFDGGNAKLILEPLEPSEDGKEVDPLEAGIEIFSQPPGKKLQHISLLSGGEKALTAIAILFAILQLKPMPFCVLDEIEAALDDANANLFAELLRMFSDRTQFIVITHRKPTMRHADTIFGVAMEEKGVTKIVSIEFEEAVKRVDEAQKQAS